MNELTLTVHRLALGSHYQRWQRGRMFLRPGFVQMVVMAGEHDFLGEGLMFVCHRVSIGFVRKGHGRTGRRVGRYTRDRREGRARTGPCA